MTHSSTTASLIKRKVCKWTETKRKSMSETEKGGSDVEEDGGSDADEEEGDTE